VILFHHPSNYVDNVVILRQSGGSSSSNNFETIPTMKQRRTRDILLSTVTAFVTLLFLLLGSPTVVTAAAATSTTSTTENQRFISSIWSSITSKYYDPTYNGLGISGWRDVEQKALQDVADTGPDDEILVENAIGTMISALNDPYTRYLSSEKYASLTAYAMGSSSSSSNDDDDGGGIGVQLLEDLRTGNIMVMSTAPNGPAAIAGLVPGDAIVNGEYVQGESADIVATKCRGKIGQKVELDYLRNNDFNVIAGKIQHVTLIRARIDTNTINTIDVSTFVSSSSGKNIGLIRIPSFNIDTPRQIIEGRRSLVNNDNGSGTMSTTPSVDAIAIDIRGNVGGYMPAGVDTAKLFLPAKKRIISEVGRTPKDGILYESDGIGADTTLPLYILVDKRTASAAEIFAAALQDNNRAVVVGTTNTFGKGRIQNVQPINVGSGSGGGGIAITRARYVTPNGRDIHGVGITPDVYPNKCEMGDTAQTCLANIV
jgi:carboxyl-terminal processing protease